MQNNPLLIIDTNLTTTIALIMLGSDLDSSTCRLQIADYKLLCNWLECKKEVDCAMLSGIHRASITGLVFVLSGIIKCSEAYVLMHLINYYNIYNKELYHDFQFYKQVNQLHGATSL